MQPGGGDIGGGRVGADHGSAEARQRLAQDAAAAADVEDAQAGKRVESLLVAPELSGMPHP